MTQLDPRIQSAIGRSQASHSPPAGCEDAMLAQLHARLGGPPDGGDGGAGGAGPSYTAGAQLVHALQITAAVVSLTAAGLGGLWLVGKAVRAAEGPERVSVDASMDVDDRAEPSDLEVERFVETEARLTDTEPTARVETLESVPVRQSSPARPTSASSPSTLAAELQLIRAARNAPPLQALELIDRHAEQFAEGELSNEREGLRVIALCELGRVDEARGASERFVARSPGALLIQRVSNGCRDQFSFPTTESQPAGNRSP
jgi:hypothetical protein